MKIMMLTPLAIVLVLLGCEQTQIGSMTFPEGSYQHAVHADDIVWKPCPPGLPAGCEITVLEGNPQAPDLFTVRFRLGGEFALPPHTHPKEERVTVLKGQMFVAFGADSTREDATRFGPGDYYVNARNAIHSVWGDPQSEIQITGIGPWEVHLVEPRD